MKQEVVAQRLVSKPKCSKMFTIRGCLNHISRVLSRILKVLYKIQDKKCCLNLECLLDINKQRNKKFSIALEILKLQHKNKSYSNTEKFNGTFIKSVFLFHKQLFWSIRNYFYKIYNLTSIDLSRFYDLWRLQR